MIALFFQSVADILDSVQVLGYSPTALEDTHGNLAIKLDSYDKHPMGELRLSLSQTKKRTSIYHFEFG